MRIHSTCETRSGKEGGKARDGPRALDGVVFESLVDKLFELQAGRVSYHFGPIVWEESQ